MLVEFVGLRRQGAEPAQNTIRLGRILNPTVAWPVSPPLSIRGIAPSALNFFHRLLTWFPIKTISHVWPNSPA